MQSRLMRAAIAVVAVIAAVVLFVVLSEGDETEPEQTPPAAERQAPEAEEPEAEAEVPEAEQSERERPEREREPSEPAIPTIVVRDGEPVGGVEELTFRSGDRIRFAIRSDVDEEVHVHGFDVYADLEAGRKRELDFPAAFEGVFEVELHGSGVEIATLTVRP